jgi:predicted GTPase
MANVVIINKVDTADPKNVSLVKENIRKVNPNAVILEASSPITADKPELVKSKRALVIEDGPTLTHGNMPYGAATIMAKQLGAREIADPRPYAVGSIKEAYLKYPHLGAVLPALGYGEKQIEELKETITRTPCDVVVIGTPVDLRRVMEINKPTVRVKYELKVLGPLSLEQILDDFLGKVQKHGK